MPEARFPGRHALGSSVNSEGPRHEAPALFFCEWRRPRRRQCLEGVVRVPLPKHDELLVYPVPGIEDVAL